MIVLCCCKEGGGSRKRDGRREGKLEHGKGKLGVGRGDGDDSRAADAVVLPLITRRAPLSWWHHAAAQRPQTRAAAARTAPRSRARSRPAQTACGGTSARSPCSEGSGRAGGQADVRHVRSAVAWAARGSRLAGALTCSGSRIERAAPTGLLSGCLDVSLRQLHPAAPAPPCHAHVVPPHRLPAPPQRTTRMLLSLMLRYWSTLCSVPVMAKSFFSSTVIWNTTHRGQAVSYGRTHTARRRRQDLDGSWVTHGELCRRQRRKDSPPCPPAS